MIMIELNMMGGEDSMMGWIRCEDCRQIKTANKSRVVIVKIN